LVTTVRALKIHGGVKSEDIDEPNPDAVSRGLPNMDKHIENIRKFQVPVIVAVNRFHADTGEELRVVLNRCKEMNVPAAVTDHFTKGGEGAVELAETLLETLSGKQLPLKPLYEYEWKAEEKIETIAKEIYGARHVDYTIEGKRDLESVYNLGYENIGVCIAKTQKSLSDNPKLLGRPEHFIVTVRRIEIAAGAGFIVPVTGEILRMPGLPQKPAYEHMDIDKEGNITGLS
ncbi:MAG: formate--tetrahydrofolate ligase, partial [Proteobacteria bacterium]|nr:formate--tetrahydrofolate ligase [Pseudomonadota bacterium]